MVDAEPVDERLELGQFAAHRMPAIDVHRLTGGQGADEGIFEVWRSPLKGRRNEEPIPEIELAGK
ncbi:hypothetical protein [Mesorhizobium qingshengii]|uniref:hypothetical protein n=1 Tax=Mesorhizobium qingshengii TaxID=1165689 RepID=UPI00115FE09D|nr:hypothetical protein [Mesorhizobium qingshengii]